MTEELALLEQQHPLPDVIMRSFKKSFQTHFLRDLSVVNEPPNTLPSMTVPDQSYSVRELYDRFAQGLPLDVGSLNLGYSLDGEDDDETLTGRHPASFDITELHALQREAVAKLQKTREEGINKVKARKKAESEAIEQKLKRLAELEKTAGKAESTNLP